MLEKTLALISGIEPGTVPVEGQVYFDELEIAALSGLLSAILYSPAPLRRRLQDHGISVVPADFYSEIPTLAEIDASFQSNRVNDFDYIFDDDVLSGMLDLLNAHAPQFTPAQEDDGSGNFFWTNSQFSYSDAMAYYCMLRHKKPATVLEVGSGFSTMIASAAIRANGVGEVICIEPYPRAFLATLPHVTVIQSPVQTIGVADFNRILKDGDCFFIDSTHTVKHDSDCIHLYLRILPKIVASIFVHAHDIFVPRTFGITELRDRQIYWTEQYLLYAYLVDNYRTKVTYSSSYNYMRHRAKLDKFMCGQYGSGGGSIWFEQQGRR